MSKNKKPKVVNTISIQRRIYPELLDKVVENAEETNTTPTKAAAKILCGQLNLTDPIRKNAIKNK
jgi:hypothetical protein